jgi:hypothetical protein
MRHCPKSKEYIKPFKSHLIEGTKGNLTEAERDAICREIHEGWSCGLLAMGTYSLSFTITSTRISNK